MYGGIVHFGLIVALALLMVASAVEDLRSREIANWKNAAVAALAPIWWWANGMALWPDIAIQCGMALAVFALFVATFAAGWMGGGDVKMIGALALWFPFQALAWLLIGMSLIGGVLTLVLMIHRLLRRSAEGSIEVPYGVAIALSALIALREPLFNRFS